MNSMAVIASDRNIAAAARKDARSPMSDIDAWIGGVVYNDNHVSTEEQSVIAETKYGPYRTKNDDLFADNNDEQGNPNNDAVMVYQDATTYVNQK